MTLFCFPLSFQINEEIPVKHLPSSEPDPHVVRIGWSLNYCSTQLGEKSRSVRRQGFVMNLNNNKKLIVILFLGEEPFSFGYGGTGKKSSDCKFADFGEKFGENDVIGCYIVSTHRLTDPLPRPSKNYRNNVLSELCFVADGVGI